MTLDDSRRPFDRLRFDHVGIERSLNQEIDLAQFRGLLLENLYEFAAYDFAFSLRVRDVLQGGEKSLAGRDAFDIQSAVVVEGPEYLPELVFSQKPVVNKYAVEPVSDGA